MSDTLLCFLVNSDLGNDPEIHKFANLNLSFTKIIDEFSRYIAKTKSKSVADITENENLRFWYSNPNPFYGHDAKDTLDFNQFSTIQLLCLMGVIHVSLSEFLSLRVFDNSNKSVSNQKGGDGLYPTHNYSLKGKGWSQDKQIIEKPKYRYDLYDKYGNILSENDIYENMSVYNQDGVIIDDNIIQEAGGLWNVIKKSVSKVTGDDSKIEKNKDSKISVENQKDDNTDNDLKVDESIEQPEKKKGWFSSVTSNITKAISSKVFGVTSNVIYVGNDTQESKQKVNNMISETFLRTMLIPVYVRIIDSKDTELQKIVLSELYVRIKQKIADEQIALSQSKFDLLKDMSTNMIKSFGKIESDHEVEKRLKLKDYIYKDNINRFLATNKNYEKEKQTYNNIPHHQDANLLSQGVAIHRFHTYLLEACGRKQDKLLPKGYWSKIRDFTASITGMDALNDLDFNDEFNVTTTKCWALGRTAGCSPYNVIPRGISASDNAKISFSSVYLPYGSDADLKDSNNKIKLPYTENVTVSLDRESKNMLYVSKDDLNSPIPIDYSMSFNPEWVNLYVLMKSVIKHSYKERFEQFKTKKSKLTINIKNPIIDKQYNGVQIIIENYNKSQILFYNYEIESEVNTAKIENNEYSRDNISNFSNLQEFIKNPEYTEGVRLNKKPLPIEMIPYAKLYVGYFKERPYTELPDTWRNGKESDSHEC